MNEQKGYYYWNCYCVGSSNSNSLCKRVAQNTMKQSAQLYEPATARQKLIITRLCMKLKIEEPLEEKVMTIAEAGRLIRELARRKK